MIMTATFGILVSVIGIVMVIIEIVNGVECSHGEDMPYCREIDMGFMNTTTTIPGPLSTTPLV